MNSNRRLVYAAVALFGVVAIYLLLSSSTHQISPRGSKSQNDVLAAGPASLGQKRDSNKITEKDVFADKATICSKLIHVPKQEVKTFQAPPPPQWNELTPVQQQAHLLFGRTKLSHYYIDGRSGVKTDGRSDEYIPRTRKYIESLIAKAKRREENYYGKADTYLYEALDKFPVKGKDVLILGSLVPWYEAVALAFGAKTVTTIEYNKLEYDHPQIKTLTVHEYLSMSDRPEFEVAFSISSYEHDGLGRYGDPINPIGDLQTMLKVKCFLKEDALLYLAVPLGVDTLRWNADRNYGRKRLPMLLKPFTAIASFGLTLGDFDEHRSDHQPVFVALNGAFVNDDIYWIE